MSKWTKTSKSSTGDTHRFDYAPCPGNHTAPVRTVGTLGVCGTCDGYAHVNANGTLRKHRLLVNVTTVISA